MSKREKWIEDKAAELFSNMVYRMTYCPLRYEIEKSIREGIRLGLENADKIKDDEYEIDTSSDHTIRLRRNGVLNITFWCGDEGEPTKEQAEKAAQAIIKVLQEQDDA